MKTSPKPSMLIILTTLLVMSVALGTCVSMAESGKNALTTEELQALFAEHRMATFANEKTSGSVEYFPDGKQMASWSGGGSKGTYRIENGMFCSKLEFRGGAEKCTTWFHIGNTSYKLFRSDGSTDSTLTFQ